MCKLTFGTKNQIQFANKHEYFELLGFIAKSDGTTSLVWEHNEEQGAWGSEGRIHFYTNVRPYSVTLHHTAGVGGIVSRVNCNEFVKNLIDNHGFVYGKAQDVRKIKSTIPLEYMESFEKGLNL